MVRFNFQKNLSKGLKCAVGTPFHNADKGSSFFVNHVWSGDDARFSKGSFLEMKSVQLIQHVLVFETKVQYEIDAKLTRLPVEALLLQGCPLVLMPSTDKNAIVPVAHYAVDRVVKGLWIVRGWDVDSHVRHRALKAVA